MTLREQQSLFVHLIGTFIEWCYANDFELTFSEAFRSQTEAAINAQTGAGISNSLHCLRLAIDLNLFKDDNLLVTVNDYLPLGQKWESMHPLARWGGRFRSPDSDHFSLTYQGIS